MTSNQTKRARTLRKQSTDAERKLWSLLRDRNLEGHKFRRQVAIGNYIADFVCQEEKLIIEVDGGQHMENKEADDARTAWLESRGYRVVRFWNNQVLNETESVWEEILHHLKKER